MDSKKGVIYVVDKEKFNDNARNVTLIKRTTDGVKFVRYSTYINQDYKSIKNQLIYLGFLNKETKYINDNTIQMEYILLNCYKLVLKTEATLKEITYEILLSYYCD